MSGSSFEQILFSHLPLFSLFSGAANCFGDHFIFAIFARRDEKKLQEGIFEQILFPHLPLLAHSRRLPIVLGTILFLSSLNGETTKNFRKQF